MNASRLVFGEASFVQLVPGPLGVSEHVDRRRRYLRGEGLGSPLAVGGRSWAVGAVQSFGCRGLLFARVGHHWHCPHGAGLGFPLVGSYLAVGVVRSAERHRRWSWPVSCVCSQ